jgi:hypothetical protein
MELLGDVGQVKVRLVYLGTLLISAQARSMVCAERTTGMEFFWLHPMDLHGEVG